MPTQVHLNIDDELIERLRKLAARDKRSLTKMCEVILDEALPVFEATPKAKAKAGKA